MPGLDQNGPLGGHPFIVHGHGAGAGTAAQSFVDCRDSGMGDLGPDAFGEGSRTPFNLRGFQEMPAGFMEDDAAESIGQNRRHLPGIHILRPQHRAGAFTHFSGARLAIRSSEIVRSVRAAVATTNTGAVFTGGKNRESGGLMETNVAGEGAVGGCDQNLLPVAGVAAATHLEMLTEALEVNRPPGGVRRWPWSGPDSGPASPASSCRDR